MNSDQPATGPAPAADGAKGSHGAEQAPAPAEHGAAQAKRNPVAQAEKIVHEAGAAAAGAAKGNVKEALSRTGHVVRSATEMIKTAASQ